MRALHFQGTWPGTILVHCRDEQIVANASELVLGEGPVVNGFSQELDRSFGQVRVLEGFDVFGVDFVNTFINLASRRLACGAPMYGGPVVGKAGEEIDDLLLVIVSQEIFSVEQVLLYKYDEQLQTANIYFERVPGELFWS